MNLLEYEAKNILKNHGITVPAGVLVRSARKRLTTPVVLKSQVHTGGRGKLGGVRIVHEQKNITYEIKQLLQHEIKGEKPRTLLAEELLNIDRELYLSINIDRARGEIYILANSSGGVDIESQDIDGFFQADLDDKRQFDAIGEELAEYYRLPSQSFVIQELIHKLYTCFTQNDATLLEINPLALTSDDQLVAGDCKLVLDDAAKFRHPEWEFEQQPADSNFVLLDPTGKVATMANGAGLAMATVDAVVGAGLKPANFLDIGGAATPESIVANLAKIYEIDSVQDIIINIFGGIVRCDDVARAIIEAGRQFDSLPTLYVRLAGNRSRAARQLLVDAGYPPYSTLSDCLEAIKP